MKILEGKEVRDRIFSEVSEHIKAFDDAPRLIAVVIGDDPACVSYANAKGRKAEALGVQFEVLHMPGDTSQSEAENELRRAIKRMNPNGVIIEKPVPKHIDFTVLTELIPPTADVDCQRMDNMGRLLSGQPRYVPATAGAVMEILKHFDIAVEGKEVVIVGRSLTVGLPLSVMLLGKNKRANATVTVCHSCTPNIAKHTKRADILVAAAGRAGLVNGEMISKGTIVIDVGTNYVDGKLVGDVDYDSAVKKAAAITPVPGGVGPVTTAFLLRNLVTAFVAQKGK